MSYKETHYPESRLGGFTDIDGTVVFFTRVNALLQPSGTVLDVGCGRGAYSEDPSPTRRSLRAMRGKVSRVIGLDVDEAAAGNPFLDEFRLLRGDRWPIDSDSIDLIVCDHTLEHVTDPDALFAEARRTLKDGGYFCIRTPNRWSYVALLATVIPNRFHGRVVSRVQTDRKEVDVFPTVYRCHSVRRIRKMMRKFGFDPIVYGYEAEPTYLSFSRFAFALGVLHQRCAPRFLKASIFAFGKLRKTTS